MFFIFPEELLIQRVKQLEIQVDNLKKEIWRLKK